MTTAAPPTKKERTHARIVEVAARAIRRSGYGGTGVADIMKEAGLTHGGFYAHFASREALLAEAADRAGAESVDLLARITASVPHGQGLQALIAAYLSPRHLAETGCPMAALGSEMPRQAPEVREAATRRIRQMLDLVERQLPAPATGDGPPAHADPQRQQQAMVLMATLVGTVLLSRAVDDPALSAQFRQAALAALPAGPR